MRVQLRQVTLSMVGFACATLLSAGAVTANDSEEAAEFLISLSESAIEKLTDPSAGETEKEQRFRELMEMAFDLPKIGKFVLGVNWRKASPDQRRDFIDVFEDVQVQSFLPLFSNYSDEKFTVTKVRQDQKRPELFFVSSTIHRPGREPYFVEWRLRQRSDQYKILDVKAEGVSMAVTLRKEYGSVANDQGIDGLITRLRQKVVDGTADTGAVANSQ